MTWSKKITYGNQPSPRCRHSTNFLKGKLYIFGGNDCDMSFNSIFTLKLLLPSSLKKDLRGLLDDSLFSDVTFILDNKSQFKAHKAILASRCEVFKNMLMSSMKEGLINEIEIKDTSPDVFKNLINYIYTDEVQLHDITMAVNLLIEANKYNLSRLKNICEMTIVKVLDIDNVIDLLHLSDIHEASELRSICLDYAVQHFDVVTKRKDFEKLSKLTILEILQRK